MLIRSAFWVGRPRPGAETRFRELLDADVMPRMRALPGVSDAWTLWPLEREDSPPDLTCQVLVTFEDRAALERMLASAERRALRAQVAELKDLFDGAMSHINYEVERRFPPSPDSETAIASTDFAARVASPRPIRR